MTKVKFSNRFLINKVAKYIPPTSPTIQKKESYKIIYEDAKPKLRKKSKQDSGSQGIATMYFRRTEKINNLQLKNSEGEVYKY